MKVKYILLPLLLGLWSAPSYAISTWQTYEVNIDQANWMAKSSLASCQMYQKIPGYGVVKIINNNGREPQFIVTTSQGPAVKGMAQLGYRPQGWTHGQQPKLLGDVKVHPGYEPFVIGPVLTRKALQVLKSGLSPTLVYSSWKGLPQRVMVTLSPVQFGGVYKQYLKCSDQLLPYSFEDVEHTVFKFSAEDYQLSVNDLKQLGRIAALLKRIGKIQAIVIDSYAYEEGNRLQSWILTEQRAEAVADELMRLGVAKDQIIIRPHGDTAVSSTSAKMKADLPKRRVEVTLVK